MTKRLLLSALTIGAIGAALAFGAYAYFFDGSSTAVTVNAASGLTFTYDIDQDCDGAEATGLTSLPPTTVTTPLFPGDTNHVCVTMHNDNPTDVDGYVHNDTVVDSASHAFLDVLYVSVKNTSDGTTPCGNAAPDSAQYTTANNNRGCNLGNIAPGGSKTYEATVLFYDDGTDQEPALASATANWNTTLGGSTTP